MQHYTDTTYLLPILYQNFCLLQQRVLYVRVSSNEAIFDGLSPQKEDIVHYFPVDDDDNIEE